MIGDRRRRQRHDDGAPSGALAVGEDVETRSILADAPRRPGTLPSAPVGNDLFGAFVVGHERVMA